MQTATATAAKRTFRPRPLPPAKAGQGGCRATPESPLKPPLAAARGDSARRPVSSHVRPPAASMSATPAEGRSLGARVGRCRRSDRRHPQRAAGPPASLSPVDRKSSDTKIQNTNDLVRYPGQWSREVRRCLERSQKPFRGHSETCFGRSCPETETPLTYCVSGVLFGCGGWI